MPQRRPQKRNEDADKGGSIGNKSTEQKLTRLPEIEPPKNPGGRPSFKPTDAQRTQVKVLAMVGCAKRTIADFVDIDEATLAKHFALELKQAKPQLLATAMAPIYNGLGSAREETRIKCGMYILDRQAREYGWSPDTSKWFENKFLRDFRLEKLTIEELKLFIQLLEKGGCKFKPPRNDDYQ